MTADKVLNDIYRLFDWMLHKIAVAVNDIDVTADLLGAAVQKLGPAAQRRGADHGALGHRRQAGMGQADEGVADILARK